MTAELPQFRYHPDPLASGSVEESAAECEVCGEARGYRYTGPVYGEEVDEPVLCPWCIADGSAAEALGIELTDVEADSVEEVPEEVLDEVLHRTPGFVGWQQEHWMFHCAGAAAFLGPAGAAELAGHPDALEELRAEGVDLASLDRDGAATAYLFRCLECGAHLAYADAE